MLDAYKRVNYFEQVQNEHCSRYPFATSTVLQKILVFLGRSITPEVEYAFFI